MGFLDKFKDAADDMKDKVSDATGYDTDKVMETGKSLGEAAENLNAAQDSWAEAKRD